MIPDEEKDTNKAGKSGGHEVKRRNSTRSTSSERAAKVAGLTEKLHSSVAELTSSVAWTRMLKTAARFHRYSARNMLFCLSRRRSEARRSLGLPGTGHGRARSPGTQRREELRGSGSGPSSPQPR